MANHGFNLDEFIAQNTDYARGYTFYIHLEGGSPVETEQQRFLVRSASLPASTVTPAEVNWQGNVYKIGATQEFSEFTVTYSVDINDSIRKDYEAWMVQIHDPKTNEHGTPADYMKDVHLEHISHQTGNTLMTYSLIKAWPSAVGEMSLDYSSKETAEFEVTFTYQYHTSI